MVTKPIRVLLADDHALFRAGIRALLQNLGVEVVGEAEHGQEAVRLAAALHPEIVLMDIGMGDVSGLVATAQIRQAQPDVRVIILSMFADEQHVAQALKAGASGYLLKGARTPELELALTAVANGETYLSPSVSKHLINAYVQGGDQAAGTQGGQERLTARQTQVLKLVAAGHTNREVAQQLDISIKTVEMHRAQIMERLNVRDVTGLVRYAIQTGLIKPER